MNKQISKHNDPLDLLCFETFEFLFLNLEQVRLCGPQHTQIYKSYKYGPRPEETGSVLKCGSQN